VPRSSGCRRECHDADSGLLTMIEGVARVAWGSQPYAMPPILGRGTAGIRSDTGCDARPFGFRLDGRCIVRLVWSQKRNAESDCALAPKIPRRIHDGNQRHAAGAAVRFALATLISPRSRASLSPPPPPGIHTGRLSHFTVRGGGDRRHRVLPRATSADFSRPRNPSGHGLNLHAVFAAIGGPISFCGVIWRRQLRAGTGSQTQDTATKEGGGTCRKLPASMAWLLRVALIAECRSRRGDG